MNELNGYDVEDLKVGMVDRADRTVVSLLMVELHRPNRNIVFPQTKTHDNCHGSLSLFNDFSQ